MAIVFVGGVHGAGKSSCCARVAAQLACVHVSASELIRKERADAIAIRGKLVADVDGNQILLQRGFGLVRNAAGTTSIFLDGHFALRDSEGVIQRLSSNVFSDLGVDRLVCFVDAVEAIVRRVELRDGKAPNAGDVSLLQAAEVDNAHSVAREIGVALTILHGFDFEGLNRVMSSPYQQ